MNLPRDIDGMNNDRADWAGEALAVWLRSQSADEVLRYFADLVGLDPDGEKDEMVGDLLCDLMHWCDRSGQDFAVALPASDKHGSFGPLSDLLKGIREWCENAGMSFDARLENARGHYEEETGR